MMPGDSENKKVKTAKIIEEIERIANDTILDYNYTAYGVDFKGFASQIFNSILDITQLQKEDLNEKQQKELKGILQLTGEKLYQEKQENRSVNRGRFLNAITNMLSAISEFFRKNIGSKLSDKFKKASELMNIAAKKAESMALGSKLAKQLHKSGVKSAEGKTSNPTPKAPHQGSQRRQI